MDPTQMQQTVKESVESGVSFPQETGMTNTSSGTTVDNEERAYEPLSYDKLFPELPNSKIKSEEENKPNPTWGNKNNDMKIASSVITHMFRIPYEDRTKLDGSSQFGESASSRICADITYKTGAHIEISTAKDQSHTFLITGKTDEVLRAKKLTLEKFMKQARQVIKVPKEYHKFVLGKKGKKLQDLEASTGTKIQVPSANDSSLDIIVVGTKEGVEKAIHEIQLVSDEQNKQAYEVVEIPKIYHPFINPLTNEKLGSLVAENNVRFNIPPMSVKKNEITIAGDKEYVIQCMELVEKIYKEMDKKCQTVSVEVRKSQHKYVIGPRGGNITDIFNATNVSVEMPPSDSPTETITLRGPQEKLGSALTMVYEKANSMVADTVESPEWLHKFIIGRKGANIKRITQDLPKVHVEFTDKEGLDKEGKIRLEGPPKEVEIAHEKLLDMIAEMEMKLTFEELYFDPQYQKYIIGKNGSNVNRIRNENEVVIIITDVGNMNLARIEGSHQGVMAAKQELEEIIAKIENEKEREILIDSRFHRNIIGTKGDKIKEIRDKFNQVQIAIPDQGSENSNVVKIRGPKESVDQCYHFLQKMVKELNETNYQLKVSIFRQFHKFIIGKGGSNINKIREETNTKIDLPVEGSNSDDIIITGRKENCEQARERIQKIQNEMANIIDMDIMIPSKFHNAMIGTGGKLIQSISEDCGGVSIKFPPPDSKSDKVNIRGPKEDVQKAKQMLIEMSNEKQLSSCTAEVRAKPELHRFLIGRSGANIRKIRDKTGARIIFPNEKDEHSDIITIIGKKEAVEKAQAELKANVQELNKVVEEVISVDPKHHRYFVARRGDILRQISDQCGGVTISFPRQGSPSNKVTLKGIKECVDAAKLRVFEIVEDLDQTITLEVNIPQKYHRSVMGTRGVKVQGITSQFDVQIKFPEKDLSTWEETNNVPNGDVDCTVRIQDIVVIQGRNDKCEAARDALLELVPVTEEIPVSFKYHRFIIGQKGDTVRSLMAEHDVNIQVPPAQDQKDSICLMGPRANVEEAKVAILKKVQELIDEEENRFLRSFQLQLRIDPEYHPRIIGRKGTVISKIREKYNVNIQFPNRDGADKELITITGYEKDCDSAKQAILEITGDLDNMVRKGISIDRRIHSRLIGTRGRAIRKVMEEFKVEIKFPRGDDNPDEVVVIGVEDHVDECIDHLLNLSEEYMQDILEREDQNQYVHPISAQMSEGSSFQNQDKGFVVEGAPWNQPTPNMDSSEDFPSMGNVSTPSATPAVWGPRRS